MNFAEASRQAQKAFEPLAAMIFFVPEAVANYKALGLKGRQGYFASRSAPMGAVTGPVTAATFYNFNPVFVMAQMENAWQITTPAAVLQARVEAARAAAHRLIAPADGEEDMMPGVARALSLVKQAVAGLRPEGRPLFAAHQLLPWPEDALAALWQGITILREYRGDGHIAALMIEEVSGAESILLQAAWSPRLPLSFLLQSRAWEEPAVQAARESLAARGLVQDGVLTEEGKAWRERVEQYTDRLDAAPFQAIGAEATTELISLVGAMSKRVVARGGLATATAPAAPR